MTQHANVDTLSRLPIPYQQTGENSEDVNVFTMKQTNLLPVTAGHLKRERGRDTSVKGVQICSIRMAQNCGMLCSNIKTSIAAQPGQLLIELSKRKTFYHRSHTGNIDDGEGSTMQTQSSDDRLEGISIIKYQIGAVKVCSC